ncbi:hypothetical protein H8959_009531 [Pygathrix nigripes]
MLCFSFLCFPGGRGWGLYTSCLASLWVSLTLLASPASWAGVTAAGFSRLAKLTDLLQQEEQGREVACSALQKNQEDSSRRVDLEVARMQAQVTKLGEEVSLRFLKREAKLCGFLQKSFLALEKRMKASENSRLRLEVSLRGELESRWEKLRGLMEERLRALQGQHEESHLLEQCQGLDAAVAQLTKFVQQNQASLNRVLLAEAKAWDAKGRLEESRAGELAAYVQENLEAAQLARELARQEMHGELVLLREKHRALEASVAQLAGQLKELSSRLPALSSRLDLQEQMLGLRLSEAKTEWEGAERKSLEDLARWQKEVAAHLRGVQEKVDGLPQQIEGVSDKCLLHKSDSDLRISAEGKAREFEVGALRQELATLLSSVQLLKEDSPGRKIAEMQGKLATFQNQIMKLENCVQASKTIQNLRFNTEARLRTQEMAALRESVLRLRSEEGPQTLLGSWKVLPSLARLRVFIKDTVPSEVVPVNCWGVYQAVRWAAGILARPPGPLDPKGRGLGLGARGQQVGCGGWGRGAGATCRISGQVAAVEGVPHKAQGPAEARRGPREAPQPGAGATAHTLALYPEINEPASYSLELRFPDACQRTACPGPVG